MKYLAAVVLIFISAVSVFGQKLTAVQEQPSMFQVTSIHKATPSEKSYKTLFNELYIDRTIGNRKYTLSQLDTWGSYHYEVGQDYRVVQIKSGSPHTVKLTIPIKYDKNGKKPFGTETLCVQSVEEIASKNCHGSAHPLLVPYSSSPSLRKCFNGTSDQVFANIGFRGRSSLRLFRGF